MIHANMLMLSKYNIYLYWIMQLFVINQSIEDIKQLSDIMETSRR